MISGQKLHTEEKKEYRKIDALNYSGIKLFDENPIKFFEKYVLRKVVPEKRSISLIIGDLLHFQLLECKGNEEEFEARMDEKFVKFEGNVGSGQVFRLSDI